MRDNPGEIAMWNALAANINKGTPEDLEEFYKHYSDGSGSDETTSCAIVPYDDDAFADCLRPGAAPVCQLHTDVGEANGYPLAVRHLDERTESVRFLVTHFEKKIDAFIQEPPATHRRLSHTPCQEKGHVGPQRTFPLGALLT